MRVSETKGMLGTNERWMHEASIVPLESTQEVWTASVNCVALYCGGNLCLMLDDCGNSNAEELSSTPRTGRDFSSRCYH